MRSILLSLAFLAALASSCEAETFRPDEAMVIRLATRFRSVLDTSGINGVGRDVLKCYDDSISTPNQMKECVVYDQAASIVDRTMTKIFFARGLDASPALLYKPDVFAARQDTYGKVAFTGDAAGRYLVGGVAQRVVQRVLPR